MSQCDAGCSTGCSVLFDAQDCIEGDQFCVLMMVRAVSLSKLQKVMLTAEKKRKRRKKKRKKKL
eukprot:UN10215